MLSGSVLDSEYRDTHYLSTTAVTVVLYDVT